MTQRATKRPYALSSHPLRANIKGCFAITTVFSHAQTVVLCASCASVLCQPTGGRARLTEGPSPSCEPSNYSSCAILPQGARSVGRIKHLPDPCVLVSLCACFHWNCNFHREHLFFPSFRGLVISEVGCMHLSKSGQTTDPSMRKCSHSKHIQSERLREYIYISLRRPPGNVQNIPIIYIIHRENIRRDYLHHMSWCVCYREPSS